MDWNSGGQQADLKSLSIRELLPGTEYYMTYDGSTTMPGCHETVTWLVMNKPIYITKQQVTVCPAETDAGGPEQPKGSTGQQLPTGATCSPPGGQDQHRLQSIIGKIPSQFLDCKTFLQSTSTQPLPILSFPLLHRLNEKST
ncbi:carbonic anhydrase-related protein 10 [Trichonephila clavata]|uniref:Carbonic anhydrase-related protein 10 n=1 Tax=Trichonephila clavata TaxID=2740835 RepID=A0A8X6J7Q3_TRICU|nr:carbonic anhydrase-related protein 10 [Trichonephila clavata]